MICDQTYGDGIYTVQFFDGRILCVVCGEALESHPAPIFTHICVNCAYETDRWWGRCPQCEDFNYCEEL